MFLSGQLCLSHVVEVTKITDNKLTCAEIEQEIEEADKFEKDARAERKVTGKNVAAAVFFWPALIGTYSNTADAIEAAQKRREHLNKLYSKKRCDEPETMEVGSEKSNMIENPAKENIFKMTAPK